jgi:hypothetical protein
MTDTVSTALIGATGAVVAALLAGSAQIVVASINNRSPKPTEPDAAALQRYHNQKEDRRRKSAGVSLLLGVIAALFGAVGIFGFLKLTDAVKNGVLVAAATIVVALILERRERKDMKKSKVLWLAIPVGGALLGIGIARARQALEPTALMAPVCIANNYYPSGYMGDGEGENRKGTEPIDLNDQWTDHCHSEPTCIKIVYHPPSNRWAGVYWQYPDGNWGDEPGRRIIGAKKLVFWVRGDTGGELVSFKIGGNDRKKYKDSLNKSLGPLKLTTEWKEYEIDLNGADTSSVIGAFSWSASAK